jgi:predicted regulator of Ras-like GTPase activity (Roadblock/LC7/MglB family)
VFDEVLRRVIDGLDDAQCVVLVGTDGVVVAAASRDGGPPPDVIAASAADLFRKVGSVRRDEGFGGTDEVAAGGDRGHIVLREVVPGYLLAASLAAGRSLGRARFELRKAAADLEPELT